jgi:hypothetical protein
MAKSQKHGNKEARKPKSEKAAPTTTPGSFLEKAGAVTVTTPKRKA